MPFAVASALFALGAPLAAVNFFAVTIGASALLTLGFNVAVGLGLSLASSALFRPTVPTGAVQKPSDGQQTIRQAVPPRWKHYGKVRISGPLFWFESNVTNKDLYVGLALNQGRIASFDEYHIDDNSVQIDGSGVVTSVPYSTVTTKILTRLGADPETAYSEIETAFGYANIRGDGVASVLGVFRTFSTAEAQQENYPNGLPKLRVTMSASVVWNPRDAAQIRTDESTWLWSENPVVCLLDYILSADGFGIPWERIEPALDDWKRAADICDEQVWSIEGRRLESRYRCAATYLLTDAPKDVVARLAETFDGRIWQRRDGAITVSAGKFVEPTVSLTDDVILSFNLERGLDRLDAAAGVRAQYMEPANDYRETDATPWPDAATVVALTDERVINQDYTWSPSHGQARRLMERSFGRAQAAWRGQITTNLAGLNAIDERFVNLQITELGINADFEVEHFSIDLTNMAVSLQVVQAFKQIDAVRPTGLSEDLIFRGHGRIRDSESVPILDYDEVRSGDAPLVGDLVIWAITAEDVTTWANPSGWTIIDNVLGAGNIRYVTMFKIVAAADLAVPPTPLSLTEGTVAHWIAYQPPDIGTATLDLFDSVTPTDGNPAAVSVAAGSITAPHVLCSHHSARNDTNIAASWTGATEDFAFEDSQTGNGLRTLFKVYSPGPGNTVSSDMGNEGSDNYQRIYIIKFI